jgi:cytoskeletal protein RodZ
VSEQLRRAREAAGLSLDDLSGRTNIRAAILEALERGDARQRLGTFYTRAFLRTYAREVNLDPDAVVGQYLGEADPDPVPTPRPDFEDGRRELLSAARSGSLSWAFVIVAAAALGMLSTLVDRSTTRSAPPGAAEAGAVGTSGQASASSALPAGADIERLTLEIRATGVVWVEVTADGQQLLYRLLQPGHAERIEAHHELNVLVGDAAALEYRINGLPGRSLGGPGEKRRMLVTPETYRQFVRPSPAP